MLTRRIAGVLRQYNPMVAFYTTEILIGNTNSGYLKYYNFEGTLLGPDQVIADLGELGVDLRTFMEEKLQEGRWYTNADLNQTYRTEVLTIWVSAFVNKWLKAFSASRGQPEEMIELFQSLTRLAREVHELADFVTATRTDPGRLTLNQLLYRSRRWHAAQARHQAAQEAPPAREVWRGKYSIFQLETAEALKHEGEYLQHCVATYWNEVRYGACEIYSVRDSEGQSVATFQISGGAIQQIRGQRNKRIKNRDICDTIEDFLESRGYTNPTSDCKFDEDADENNRLPAGLGSRAWIRSGLRTPYRYRPW
jgi:hypothetical protein